MKILFLCVAGPSTRNFYFFITLLYTHIISARAYLHTLQTFYVGDFENGCYRTELFIVVKHR